jgi:hypothetical protein
MDTSVPATPSRSPGRFFLPLGLALPFLGIAGYVAQVYLQRLTTPWYMPSLSTLGVVLVIMALCEARSVWRVLALLLVLLLAGAEWTILLTAKLPAYTGPIALGKAFPAFATTRADGAPFTERDFEGDQNNVLVFFRGRW